MSDTITIDRSNVRTRRNVIQWPSGAVYDPDGNLIDGSFKRGVDERLDEIKNLNRNKIEKEFNLHSGSLRRAFGTKRGTI